MIHSKKFDKSKGRNRRGICSTCGDVLGYIFGLGTESNEEKLSKLIEKKSKTLNKIVHINSQQLSIIDTFQNETELNNLNILNITNRVTKLLSYFNINENLLTLIYVYKLF